MINFGNLKGDLYRLAGVTSTTARTDIVTAVKTSIARGQREFVNYGDWSFLQQYQGQVYIPITPVYTTGTVTVTNASMTVTGSGTSWTSDMVGDFFQLSDEETYEIRSVASTTSLTLQIPYQGTTASGSTYAINKRFYNLPLDFHSQLAQTAKLQQVGTNSEYGMTYRPQASFYDLVEQIGPLWFAIPGNTRRYDYFNTGTVTVATAGGTSTWTTSSGTLPTDIVNREIRILGEEKGYLIATRGGATTLTTLDTYVNPSDATNVITAATYAITPKETIMIAIGGVPNAAFKYIFNMAYVKKLPDLIADTDISPISLNGFDSEFIAVCRAKFAEDYRSMVKKDFDTQMLIQEGIRSLGEAWLAEQQRQTDLEMNMNFTRPVRQASPSWI